MKIRSKLKEYSLEMVDKLLENKKRVFGGTDHGRLFYFIDRNVYTIYGNKIRRFVAKDPMVVIDAKEANKEYARLAGYFKALIDGGFTRNDTLVTIGGGILQDISGFIASTLYRGVKWALIPTTLLAQADSCIGSKTSVNFGASKNLIGTFYPPDRIYIDTDFCRTLTREYFNSGLGEIIKFHLMSDGAGYRSLMRYLAAPDLRDGARLRQIIRSTLMIKRSYFEGDEFDAGRRNLLNYGHCFGHALESASGFAVCHGEAVIVGMDFANLVSRTRGIMKRDTCEEFGKIMTRYYPAFDLAALSAEDIIRHMRRDKKRVGKDLTMILSRGIGEQFKYNDIKEDEIRKAYAELVKIRRTCPLRRGSKER